MKLKIDYVIVVTRIRKKTTDLESRPNRREHSYTNVSQ